MPKNEENKTTKPPEPKMVQGLKATPVNQFAVFAVMSKPWVCPHGWIAIHQAVAGGTPWFVDASQDEIHPNLYQVNGVN